MWIDTMYGQIGYLITKEGEKMSEKIHYESQAKAIAEMVMNMLKETKKKPKEAISGETRSESIIEASKNILKSIEGLSKEEKRYNTYWGPIYDQDKFSPSIWGAKAKAIQFFVDQGSKMNVLVTVTTYGGFKRREWIPPGSSIKFESPTWHTFDSMTIEGLEGGDDIYAFGHYVLQP
jgi:hypothetical protein